MQKQKPLSELKKKKYKALMLDVDGTIIPVRLKATPSPKVAEAIKKARKKIHIGVATARPLHILNHIVDTLSLRGPSIINGGAQIIDFPSKKILWEQAMKKEDLLAAFKILKRFKIFSVILDDDEELIFDGRLLPEKILQMYVPSLDKKTADRVIDKLSVINSIAPHKTVSWSSGKVDVVFTHAYATKQHGILEVAKILKISTHDIIGVGDGYNDFPLLMACGLKVAIGNAVDDLKDIADYVAPTVYEDGVVDVIEKFVL